MSDVLREHVNDFLRRVVALSITGLGVALTLVQTVRLRTSVRNQKRLARKYGITSITPILTFGPELERSIDSASAKAGKHGRLAWTSGSTAKPKGILYTSRRLRSVKFAYVDFFARCCWSFRFKRTSLYVFSSLNGDDSLTSMLIEENGLPPYLSSLQAPYRVHSHPAIQSLALDYGTAAVRLWILALANPGVLYSTNPSTLSTFLDELETDWQRSARLIYDWCGKPEVFDGSVHVIAKRIASRGSNARLERIAASDKLPPMQVWAPGVHSYICWTGGYVSPFLERLAAHLPPERYRQIPMYSMSTETIETVGHFRGDKIAFLPLAGGVLYEFIEQRAEDLPEHLLIPGQLRAGRNYSMVVSDDYGLCRYQTGDVFLCKGLVAGLPDLSFLRRRNLEYSFTGEKITSEQLLAVFRQLRSEYPQLGADRFLSCMPSHSAGGTRPHYKILLVNDESKECGVPVTELASRCNELLGEVNREYKSKCQSGRLGLVEFVLLTRGDFIDRVAGSNKSNSWESQFKFLPLYQHTWESMQT